MRKHVAISGTGRAGTTFLVQLLTELGFDTGFSADAVSSLPRASFGGLERDIRSPSAPYIVKSPWLCDYIDEVVGSSEIFLEHLIIPIRSLKDAADSRRRVSALGEAAGGMWHTESADDGIQEGILAHQLYKLLLSAASTHVPVTLMRFPLLALNKEYLYEKLLFLIEPAGISPDDFGAAFALISKPERINFFR